MLFKKKSFIGDFFSQLLSSKVNITALSVVLVYLFVAILSKLQIICSDWTLEVGASYEAPSIKNLFGTDLFGRSVLKKIIKSTENAVSVGFCVSFIAMIIGVSLGVLAGYFGGLIDEIAVWIYTTVASVPTTILLISIAYILGKGLFAVYIALSFTLWLELFQIVRSEVRRHVCRDYVLAASALGATNFRKIFYHIMPNILHVIIVKLALIFQQAIKSEVILAYLGLGVQDSPSWGRMIDEAKVELMRGVWWQLVFATLFMFVIVLAFNILSDVVRDAFDPRLKKG